MSNKKFRVGVVGCGSIADNAHLPILTQMDDVELVGVIAEHIENAGFVEVVKIQEEKLFKFIGYPALICTLISGAWLLVLEPAWLKGGWMHAKFLIIALLLAYHYSLYRFLVAFRENRCFKSGKFFRAYNEVPTLAIIFITILVILKPF